MKKPLLVFAIGIFCVSCNPAAYNCVWIVKNNTEQTLRFKYLDHSYNVKDGSSYWLASYRTVAIPSDGLIGIFTTSTTRKRPTLRFDYYFEKSVNSQEEDVNWEILSEDDVVLKTWNYSDIGQSDQRFFNKSAWRLDKYEEPDVIPYIYSAWIFEISSEDIQ